MRRWILAALALGACTQTQQTGSGGALPLARAQMTPELTRAATGEARIPVRATLAGGGDASANCRAQGAGFEADFTAPAELLVPTFGPASGQVGVECAAGGRRGVRVAEPTTRRTNGIAGFPAVSVGVSSGGGSYVSLGGFWSGGFGTGPGTYEVRYPAVDVPLR